MKRGGSSLKLWPVCLLFVLLLAALGAPMGAKAAGAEKVRVGVFPLGNFQNVDQDGEYYDYNIDYLEQIAKYAHWEYEYVKCSNWVEATSLLEEGKIDLLAPAQKIASLEERFDYTVYSMGTEFAAVYARKERDDLLFEDFDTMAGLRYGGAENSTFTDKFLEEYSVNAGFEPKLASYPNTTALFRALNDGKVDAVVTNIMFANPDIKLLARFSPLPVYYITTKGNDRIREGVNDAMTTIRLMEPSLEAELMAQYFPVFNNTQYTYREMEYIKTAPAITIGYRPDRAPLSYTDEKTGEFAGIVREILDRIQAETGLTFRYKALGPNELVSEDLRESGIYVLAGVDDISAKLSGAKLLMSTPYLKTEKVVVADKNYHFDAESHMRAAVFAGYGLVPEVNREIFPYAEIQEYYSVEECFEAVRSGKADVLIQNRYTVEPLLSKPIYQNMTVIPVQNLQEEFCIGILGGEESLTLTDGVLLDIVDKAIKRINDNEINNIVISNTAKNRYQLTVGDAMYQYRVMLIIAALLVALCMGLMLRARRLEEEKNAALREKNEQLSTAIRQAEQANSSKSQFLSRMSNEIRTPMNAVVGLTAIARIHKDDPAAVNEYLSKIESSSKVLLSIINDVLDMSAIENYKLKIARNEFDIKTVLTGISAIYYPQCRQKGVRFSMATDISNEALIGDSLRLNQILMNLVSNAYKFTDPGGEIRILAKETTRKDNKIYLRFTVSDTGVGMSEEMLSRLFRPFEQENAVTAQKYGGSGLGMSIARNLVDMMHGAIQAESRVGEGTTFTVDIPFEDAGHTICNNAEKVKDIRVLAVDDDKNAREYTSIILNRIGVSFDMATTGEEAVEMLRRSYEEHNGYDICFIDWRMPGMDGIEVTRRIRELFSPDTVIIIVSAFDLSEVEEEATSAGADMFIPKPMFQSTIFDLLMNLSGGKYAKRSADERSYNFTGYKVLLAEDNLMNREIAVDLLQIVHMEADCAVNGQQAVELFVQSRPGTYAAILMDIQMPVMNGHEASRAIRASEHAEASSIPIYAMTANAFTEDVSAALSAGMNGHIAKPIDTELLYGTLQKCVDRGP